MSIDGLMCLAGREAKGYEHPLIQINSEHETELLLFREYIRADWIDGKRHLHLTKKGKKIVEQQLKFNRGESKLRPAV